MPRLGYREGRRPFDQPNWLTRLLPVFIAESRKGLIWFAYGGGVVIGEITKFLVTTFGLAPETAAKIQTELTVMQFLALAAVTFWTKQIADEDSALKMGQVPPAQPPAEIEHELTPKGGRPV